MFSFSSCSSFLCQRDIEYLLLFKEKLMPTKEPYLLHFLKRIFNHLGVYSADIFCIQLLEISTLFCLIQELPLLVYSFLYSSRKTNRLNSWLTKKSFSLLKYQDRYVPFGLFQFLLLFGRFGNICSKFMPLILKNFLFQKVRDTFHRSSCKIWQTMVAKVLCF